MYKLEEIDRRVGLLRASQRVLDLGASPGSWTLYAAQRVGPKGRVVAVDQNDLTIALPRNASFEKRDVLRAPLADFGSPSSFDVVLSDMAPATTGQRSVDQARSQELFMRALSIAQATLAWGGAFVGKLFQGPDFAEAKQALSDLFSEVRIVRPKATRSESFETFLVGRSYRGTSQTGEACPEGAQAP